MKRSEAIHEACEIISLAYHSIGDYKNPSDGFCDECLRHRDEGFYQNAGEALEYVRYAVLRTLKADGFRISNQFSPMTGRPYPVKESEEEV